MKGKKMDNEGKKMDSEGNRRDSKGDKRDSEWELDSFITCAQFQNFAIFYLCDTSVSAHEC